MNLSPAEASRVLEALSPQLERGCPFCTARRWSLGDLSALTSLDEDNNLLFSGPITPVVTVVCSTCGHLALFSAIGLGLMDAEGKRAT